MKRILVSTIVIITVFLMNACGNDKEAEPDSVELDLCELLNEELVKATFNLPADIAFEKTDDERICMYGWSDEDASVFYSLALNFARGGQRSDADAQAVWESQSEGIYKDKDMQEVGDVGDQATWSTLGGGQLRVLYDGYIFYVSLSAYPSEGAMATPEMIEKTSMIAEAVIDKL